MTQTPTTQAAIELKACPWCSAPAEVVAPTCEVVGGKGWFVSCSRRDEHPDLTAYVYAATEAEAVAAWNTRLTPAADPGGEVPFIRAGENVLVVASAPLDCGYALEFEHCSHVWEQDGDGGSLGGNRTEVICRRCACPGEHEEDFGRVTWPTT